VSDNGLDFGVFAVDGAVRGNRPKGKGPEPNFDNPQPRRAYCDGIRAFALENHYPTFGAAPPPC
jgi:hypothetical protein